MKHLVKRLMTGLGLVLLAAGLVICLSLIPADPYPRFQPLPFPRHNEVLDQHTGLIWKRCPAGTGTVLGGGKLGCFGTPLTLDASLALSYASTVAQQDQLPWRVPDIEELNTLVDTTHCCMAFPSDIFPAKFGSKSEILIQERELLFGSNTPFRFSGFSGGRYVMGAVLGSIDIQPESLPTMLMLVRTADSGTQ